MLYAMFAVVILTMLIGLITIRTRISCFRSGKVSHKYYKLMQGDNVPEVMVKTSRCFNNMFQLPMLFYVVCSLYIAVGIENTIGLVVAWLFVISRCLHSYIHITYNNVIHRMRIYIVNFFCVLLLWINLFFQIQ